MSTAKQPRKRRLDDPDRTARARIRDAAIERFAAEGVAAANLKDIAADAGVSTPLVLHHFGSKEGLRVACDEHVASVIRTQKQAAMAEGTRLDPFQAIRDAYGGTSVIKYLATTLVDSSPHVDEFIDEMIEDSIEYMAEGVENGVLTPTDKPRERAIVLALWQFGALVLHEHAKRLLGVDLASGRPEDALRWGALNAEILARSVITEDFYATVHETMADAIQTAEHEATTPTGTDQEAT